MFLAGTRRFFRARLKIVVNMMAARNSLTEAEKIDLLKKFDIYPHKWTTISRLTGIAPSTIKSFYQSYQRHGTLCPKRGPKPSIDPQDKQDVLTYITIDPELSLRDLASMTDMSKSMVCNILHANNITYHAKTPVSRLTPTHMRNRVAFATQFANTGYPLLPNMGNKNIESYALILS